MLEFESPSVEPVEDTMLAALFATSEIPRPPQRGMPRGVGVEQKTRHEHGRRSTERWRLRGKPHLLRRTEAHHIRASQIAAGVSSSRTVETVGGTTEGAVAAEDTTEGVQIAEDVGSGEPDPPAY